MRDFKKIGIKTRLEFYLWTTEIVSIVGAFMIWKGIGFWLCVLYFTIEFFLLGLGLKACVREYATSIIRHIVESEEEGDEE